MQTTREHKELLQQPFTLDADQSQKIIGDELLEHDAEQEFSRACRDMMKMTPDQWVSKYFSDVE